MKHTGKDPTTGQPENWAEEELKELLTHKFEVYTGVSNEGYSCWQCERCDIIYSAKQHTDGCFSTTGHPKNAGNNYIGFPGFCKENQMRKALK